MGYRLIITERATELLDHLVYHLLYRFKSKQAADHFLHEVSKIYDRIESNPFQFPLCRDTYLKRKEYRVAVLSQMNYIIIYKIQENDVIIMGIFHEQEQYEEKL